MKIYAKEVEEDLENTGKKLPRVCFVEIENLL